MLFNTAFLTIASLLSIPSFANAIIDEETLRRKLNGESLYKIVDRSEEEYENGSLIELQFPKIEQLTTDLNLVLLNEIQFSSLRCHPDSCSGEKCECMTGFCKTKADNANEKPENFPTFNQVSDSEFCHAQQKAFELNEIYEEIQNYDEQNNISTPPVELIVFDMGNTKAPERFGVPLKVAMPNKKIVSNARPLTDAMTMCDNVKNELTRKNACNKQAVRKLTQRVADLLCRDPNPNIDGCVLLLNSEASESLDYYDLGDTPVAYVYGPTELILSNYPVDLDRASCNKYKVNRPKKVKKVISDKGLDEKKIHSNVNCAATAAANMKELVEELKHKNQGQRFSINTLDLPFALEKLIMDVWGSDLNDDVKADMVVKAEKDVYGVPFSTFLEKKGEKMDEEMKKLANDFMDVMYEELELEDDEGYDETGAERKLKRKKKSRMTDWALSK